MPHVKFEGEDATFFSDAESDGRRWIAVPHWLHLSLSSWQLITTAREEADNALPGPPIREIRGTARFTSANVAVMPEANTGLPELFNSVSVTIYEDEKIPHADLLEVTGPIYFAHWPAVDERPYRTKASLSLGVAMPPTQFAAYWTALQMQGAATLGLTIDLTSYGGYYEAFGLQWGPREYESPGTVFIRPQARPEVRLTHCMVSAGSSGSTEDVDTECATLTEKLRGEAPHGSNYARAVREGMESAAKGATTTKPAVEGLKHAADQLSNYLQDLEWTLDRTPAGADGNSRSLDHPCTSIWRPMKVQQWLTSGGKLEAELDHTEVSEVATGYLERADRWSSPTIERVLLHALIQSETIAFGKHLGDTIFTQDFGFSGLLAHGGEFDGSLASYGKLRIKRYFQGWGIYLGLWVLVALLTWGAVSNGENGNAWLGGGAGLLAAALVLRAAWVIGWSVFRLFVKDPKITQRMEHLQLLTSMAQLADQFPEITSPHEAAAALQRLESKGAKWPKNTWALLHGALNRGQSYWGPALSYRL
jgi:hypothetical protein